MKYKFLLIIVFSYVLLMVEAHAETYPKGWPVVQESEGCENFKGFYKGVGKTYIYRDNEVIIFKALSIANAILVGAMGKDINYISLEYQPDEKHIVGIYYGDKLLLHDQAEVSKPKYSKQVPFSKLANCIEGHIELQYGHPWMGNGESYPYKREATSSLFKAESGELIVKYSETLWKKNGLD